MKTWILLLCLGPLLDHPLVEEPSGPGIDRPFHRDLDPERVPVEAAALVPFGRVRQEMRRLEREGVREPDVQWSPIDLWVWGMRRASG